MRAFNFANEEAVEYVSGKDKKKDRSLFLFKIEKKQMGKGGKLEKYAELLCLGSRMQESERLKRIVANVKDLERVYVANEDRYDIVTDELDENVLTGNVISSMKEYLLGGSDFMYESFEDLLGLIVAVTYLGMEREREQLASMIESSLFGTLKQARERLNIRFEFEDTKEENLALNYRGYSEPWGIREYMSNEGTTFALDSDAVKDVDDAHLIPETVIRNRREARERASEATCKWHPSQLGKDNCCCCGLKMCRDCRKFNKNFTYPGIEGLEKKTKCCEPCYTANLEFMQKVDLFSKALDCAGFCTDVALRCGALSHTCFCGVHKWIQQFRTIQLRPPTEDLTENERRALWNNRHKFKGHGLWLVQLARSIDWDDAEQAKEVTDIIMSEKEVSAFDCRSVGCYQHSCVKTGLQALDCVVLLISSLKLSKDIRWRLVERLVRQSDKDVAIGNSITQLVRSTHYEEPIGFVDIRERTDVDVHSPVSWLLLRTALCQEDPRKKSEYCLKIYLALSLRAGTQKLGARGTGACAHLRNVLVANLALEGHEEDRKKVMSLDVLFNLLREGYRTASVDSLTSAFVEKFEAIAKKPEFWFALPCDPCSRIVGISQKVKKFNSAVRPLRIEFLLDRDGERATKRYMFKPDDVLKDKVLLDAINIINYELQKMGEFQNIATYEVMPFGPKEGILEYMDAVPVKEISQQELGMKDQEKIIVSSAQWNTVVYMLGIGDRHNENVMFMKDGTMAQIDFGFILGEEVDGKPWTTCYSWNPQLKSVKEREEYRTLCCKFFENIRKHTLHFHTYFNVLFEDELNSPKIEEREAMEKKNRDFMDKVIMSRFSPNVDYEVAEKAFTDNFLEAFFSKVVDNAVHGLVKLKLFS